MYYTHSYQPIQDGEVTDVVVCVVDDNLYLWISADESNLDYQQYLAWVAEGNTPEPWNPE